MKKNLISARDLAKPDLVSLLEKKAIGRESLDGQKVYVEVERAGTWAQLREWLVQDGASSCDSHRDAGVAFFEGKDRAMLNDVVTSGGPAIVNVGNDEEEPLAALAAVCSIRNSQGSIDGLRIGLLGNLHNDAIVHSVALLLARFDVRLSLISPAALALPPDLTDQVRAAGIEIEETNDLVAALAKLDVLYLAPVDPERSGEKLASKVRALYPLSPALFATARRNLFICGEWDDAKELLSSYKSSVTVTRRNAAASLVALLSTP